MGVRVPSWAVSQQFKKPLTSVRGFFVAPIARFTDLNVKSGLARKLKN